MTRRLLSLVALACAAGTLVASSLQPGTPVAMPEFVEVPAGAFEMGAGSDRDPDAYDNERWSSSAGTGTVDVGTFYIARTETTVEQFAAFVGATGRRVDGRALDGAPSAPVVFVSWPDALAYGRWVEAALKASPATPPAVGERLASGWRVRLPTEAQWEKAARGTDGRRFQWGGDPRPDRATFGTTGPTAAGHLLCPECPYGLRDMSGNVWEWTASPYQPYPYTEADDRANLDADALWVMRGGHFGDPARMVRTTARGAAEPGARRVFIGFRLALVAPK